MDGMINIYKESGYTSHDVVARLRGILHTRKIGHTGTLDPMAEGVLPVCVGSATKLCETFTDHDKEYEAVMLLGKRYDTLDITGVMTESNEVMSTEEEIVSAVKSFAGGYDQVPPMYSAKKIDGQKLYDLARSGKTVERKPVVVKIYDSEILSVELPKVRMRVKCGKGTYIRSLIDDIGNRLGCGAAMAELTRTKVGNFDICGAIKLSELEKKAAEDRISDVIITVNDIFSDLEGFTATPDISKLLRNGNVIDAKSIRQVSPGLANVHDGQRIRMFDSEQTFLGVYEYKRSRDIYKPYKMFLN